MHDFTHCLLVNFQIGNDKPGTTFDTFFCISIILGTDCIKISLDLRLDCIKIKVTQKEHEHSQTQEVKLQQSIQNKGRWR